jgi:hypothetical protein
MSNANENGTHRWQTIGLGAAPITLTTYSDHAARADEDGMIRTETKAGTFMTKGGGTCAACGKAIMVLVGVMSADGKRFHVGTECAAHAGDVLRHEAVKAKLAARAAKQRKVSAATRWERCAAAMAANRDTLAAHPHPKAWAAAKGLTLADWCDWMAANGGARARVEVCRAVEAIIG